MLKAFFRQMIIGVLKDSLREAGHGTKRRARNVKMSVEPLQPCLGDPTLLRQVLSNLISNALKYTRERERPVITVSEVSGNGRAERTYVVRDNGAGFDMRHASRLFQVFERLHDQKRFEGTGIGLATSKRIIERHGGRIWAEAAPDAGAAFFFTLPSPTQIVSSATRSGAEIRG